MEYSPEVLQGLYPVIRKISCGKECYDMTVLCPEIAIKAKPGQFVHVKAEGFSLRRPISICGIDQEAGTIRIVFEVRGEGTAQIAQIAQNQNIDLMGPLGNGFTLLDSSCKAIVVGGGIGVPPMLQAIAHYGKNGRAVLGFRSADAVILEKDFVVAGAEVTLCTDDGSRGEKGFVTQALDKILNHEKPDIMYACGPIPMLKAIATMAMEKGIRCQISLEERMGCGIGACLVCACKTRKLDGETTYAHVCKDGPVFEAENIVFE